MKIIYILCLCIGVAASTLAQLDYGFDFSKAGTSGFQFLKIGVGARESALGDAAASLTNDANAVFWNVGALPLVETREVIFTHNEWLAGSSHDAVVVALPFRHFTVAVNAVRLAIEEFEETTVLEPDGTGRMVRAGDVLVGLAIGRRFTDRLTIGGQIKFVQETLDTENFSNFLFDIGALYYTGFRQLRLGFSLQHFGPDMKIIRQSFRMPLLFRLSAADEILENDSFRLSAGIDLVHPTDNVEWVNMGVELELYKSLALRGGYRLNVDEGNLSLGVGVNTPQIGGVFARFDYAYVKYGDIFGATHRFSVSLGL
jgi:hypothetical protein